jgi:chromosome segregation ATPase
LRNDVTDLRNDVTDLRNDVTDLRNDVTAMKTDLTKLKSESETQSELLGKVNGAVMEMHKGQEELLETARIMEARLFRLEKHAGFAKA